MTLEGWYKYFSKKDGGVIKGLEERQKQEETLWRKRSRISSLKEGDKNTQFFHKPMLKHRYHNCIFSQIG